MKKIFIISLIVMLLSCLSLDYFGKTVTGIVLGFTSGVGVFISGCCMLTEWVRND